MRGIGGTEVVLKRAAKKRKMVVIASTSEVYGKSADVPFGEDADLVLGPTSKSRWAYACSKMLDEYLALASHAEKQVPVIIVRLFNTIGPRQTGRYGMVVPRFVAQALAGEPITVYGDGNQSRSFTYVGLREGLRGLAAAGARHPEDRRPGRLRATDEPRRDAVRDHRRRGADGGAKQKGRRASQRAAAGGVLRA